MEDILELILTILFKPFESKYDNIFGAILFVSVWDFIHIRTINGTI